MSSPADRGRETRQRRHHQCCELFDGFSIGSNDLTQLTLGIDRGSELLADISEPSGTIDEESSVS